MTRGAERQIKLCQELGPNYDLRVIDGELCIYRDFKNGFDLEISGTNSRKKTLKPNLYLWRAMGYFHPSKGRSVLRGYSAKTLYEVPIDELSEALAEMEQTANFLASITDEGERWKEVNKPEYSRYWGDPV